MSEENKKTWTCCYCLQEKSHVFEKIGQDLEVRPDWCPLEEVEK